MEIPTPYSIKLLTNETETEKKYTERIIDEFITAVKYNNFHFMSTKNEKQVFYPDDADYCKEYAFVKAIKLLKEKGWNVSYAKRSCARGSYNAISIL